ncbi:MAG: transposase, partial [Candidatus Accumulibacter phosphatis]|nr:transposase [Candidatus Accumulibacter phosphatis]
MRDSTPTALAGGSALPGVFDAEARGGLVFHKARGLDTSAIKTVQTTVRRRLLLAAHRRGQLTEDEAQAMADWAHGGGFSVDAEVRIEGNDRTGLERRLRYCARPAFALERRCEIDAE